MVATRPVSSPRTFPRSTSLEPGDVADRIPCAFANDVMPKASPLTAARVMASNTLRVYGDQCFTYRSHRLNAAERQ